MNRIIYLFVVSISAISLLPACSKLDQQSSGDIESATASTGEIFHLDQDQLMKLKEQAKQGDVNAALKVSKYYEFSVNSPELAYPWLAIAAEKGNISAMKGLGIYLGAEGGIDNCKSALAWLERAKREAKNSEEIKQYFLDEAIVNLNTNFQKCIERGVH
ncbi:MAG: hypothetical protein ACREPB_04815 [Arenimonas sp.]